MAAREEEEITMGGREEEKGTLVFSLCIHSDFVIFLCGGGVHLIL